MRYRRRYTLYTRKNTKGKSVWYFRIYLPNGIRKAKSTGYCSKEKAIMYVEQLLEDEIQIRKVFESDLVLSIGNTSTLQIL